MLMHLGAGIFRSTMRVRSTTLNGGRVGKLAWGSQAELGVFLLFRAEGASGEISRALALLDANRLSIFKMHSALIRASNLPPLCAADSLFPLQMRQDVPMPQITLRQQSCEIWMALVPLMRRV